MTSKKKMISYLDEMIATWNKLLGTGTKCEDHIRILTDIKDAIERKVDK